MIASDAFLWHIVALDQSETPAVLSLAIRTQEWPITPGQKHSWACWSRSAALAHEIAKSRGAMASGSAEQTAHGGVSVPRRPSGT
jgi:hypothetical protein